MDGKMKRGQVTIMIIVAIAIVAFILIFFLLRTKVKIDLPGGSESVFDYESYAKKCVRDYTEEALDLMIKQGGFLQPKNGKLFNNTNIEYLCYSKANYEKCVNQHPLLIKEMKIELKEYLGPKIKECLLDMKRDFENRNAQVLFNSENPEINVEFNDDRANIEIDKEITIKKEGETRNYNKLNVEVQSPIYNLATIASEIASQEAKYCYFEFVGFGIYYPRFSVNLYSVSGETRIYSIRDNKTNKVMSIAIRSCAIPPGF